MKYPTYNQEGKEVETTLLPKEIFEVKINPDLVHQVVVSQMANRRKVIAHTKDRGEVSGGGRKPWRQKGTGRARHGSIRSPLWRGGGITFGSTKERVFKKRIPKSMKRKALFMVFSAKVKENLLFLLDKLNIEKPKTKEVLQTIKNLKLKSKKIPSSPPSLRRSVIENFKKGSCLIALPQVNKNIVLATRNIPYLKVMTAQNLNALDLLSFKYLIMPKDSIKVVKETFFKK